MQRALQQTLRCSISHTRNSTVSAARGLTSTYRSYFASRYDGFGQTMLDSFKVNARGRALAELLGDKDEEEEENGPIGTHLVASNLTSSSLHTNVHRHRHFALLLFKAFFLNILLSPSLNYSNENRMGETSERIILPRPSSPCSKRNSRRV